MNNTFIKKKLLLHYTGSIMASILLYVELEEYKEKLEELKNDIKFLSSIIIFLLLLLIATILFIVLQ
nr:MAG TPA: hypothetical protein [Crassvirales sp.]